MASPPLTPVQWHGPPSPLDTSPASHYNFHRRTSSFSSHSGRSPVASRRQSHRFSNGSQISHDFMSPTDRVGGNMGNLADELDQLDDQEYEEDGTEATIEDTRTGEDGATIRDSGVDVSYASKRSSLQGKAALKSFQETQPPLDEEDEREDDGISAELDEAMNGIARMTKTSNVHDDALITRTIGLLQDLGNQTSLEAGAQRLTTSTNSLSSHLLAQSKTIQNLMTHLLSPFAFALPLELSVVEETGPLVDELLQDLPIPDPQPLQGIQKLDRETTNVVQTLSQLTDTLQMGKQATNAAARHLRITQTMVADLRRERERADLARDELKSREVEDMLRARHSATECQNVLSGFESFCASLRQTLVEHC